MILLLCCLIAFCSETVDESSLLLLVVGTVTETTARVLVDRVDSSSMQTATASLFVDSHEVQNVTVQFEEAPRIVIFTDLEPATRYVAKFSFANKAFAEQVRFSTLNNSTTQFQQPTFAFLSCSRGSFF